MDIASKPSNNPLDALQRLVIGNQRYRSGQPTHPRQSAQARLDTTSGQHPFAAILGCSDARVPPEIIFDQGLGDLYVIRVAGNVLDDLILGGMEYAVDDLGIPLIAVLGHDQCGAVSTAIQQLGFGTRNSTAGIWTWQQGWQTIKTVPVGHLSNLVMSIKPALDKAYQQAGNLIDNAIDANISYVVEQLKSSQPIIAKRVKESRLKVIGARYNLTSGGVTFFD